MVTLFHNVIGLTRWREFVPFTIPLTVFGALFAHLQTGNPLDYRLVFVSLANVFCVAYAFMINDIEDAPDDAQDALRAHKNVIASGKLNVTHGYLACQITAAFALFFYLLGGFNVLLIGVVSLLLSHFYSWRPVRLKAWPITDVLSHVLMLSGLLMMAGFYTYSSSPGNVWWVIAAATFFSSYGQFYNQLRDFKTDKLAGLKNTAILAGEENTKLLMYFSLLAAAVSLLVGIYKGVFPIWVIITVLVCVPIAQMRRGKIDFRGTKHVDKTGSYQLSGLIIFNLIAVIWLLQAIVAQAIF